MDRNDKILKKSHENLVIYMNVGASLLSRLQSFRPMVRSENSPTLYKNAAKYGVDELRGFRYAPNQT